MQHLLASAITPRGLFIGARALFLLIFGGYALLLAICFVHELGHLLVGLLCGFRAFRMRVGPLKAVNSNLLEPKGAWTWERSPRWLDGEVAMHAVKGRTAWTPLLYILFILGGPIANFGCAVLAFLLMRGKGQVANIAMLFMLGSVYVGAANLIPFRKRGLRSDGRRLLGMLLKREREAQLYWFTLIERLGEVRRLYSIGCKNEANDVVEALIAASERLPETWIDVDGRRFLAECQTFLKTVAEGLSQSPADS